MWCPRPDFCYRQTAAGLLKWGALSDEKTGLLFTTVAGPHQCTRLPQPGRPSPCIYMSQKQGGQVILPGTRFPFSSSTTNKAIVEVFKPASTRMTSESESYYTTGRLRSISLSWYQALRFTTRAFLLDFFLMNTLGLCQVG
jgi:hypothetical protein